MSKRVIASMAVICLGAGCGAQGTVVRKDAKVSQIQLSQTRAENRRFRNRIRDLENEVFVLKDKLDTVRVRSGRVTAAAPSLPVEVRAPTEASPRSRSGEQVVGLDSQGREIVYVGDATKDDVARPKLGNIYGPNGTRRRRRPSAHAPVPSTTDVLPVARGNLPTVQNQLAGARVVRRLPIEARIDPRDPRQEYRRHYDALRNGRHAEAIKGFRAFVRRYPRHDYADNAQYWLGESYYDQKKYREALVEFRKVVARYPNGNKLPDAMLKLGFTYAAVGEAKKARDVLKQVATIYPKSRAATLASQRLSQLTN